MCNYLLDDESWDRKRINTEEIVEYHTTQGSSLFPVLNMSMHGTEFETHRSTIIENKGIAQSIPFDKNVSCKSAFWYIWYPKFR